MIFDGDCGFCRRWIARWRNWSAPGIDYQSYQTPGLLDRFPEISIAECERAVVLIDASTREKWSGAEAVFKVISTHRWFKWTIHVYRGLPLAALISETVYRWVARNRRWLSKFL